MELGDIKDGDFEAWYKRKGERLFQGDRAKARGWYDARQVKARSNQEVAGTVDLMKKAMG